MNTADKPGVYKNFSGYIDWKSANCKVRNADFEIFEKDDENYKEIVFDDAVFVSGRLRHCVVKNALNLGCDFLYSDIKYMINKSGKIYRCYWYDGIFEGGVFDVSIWYDGIWIKGKWFKGRNSDNEEMALPPDQWEEN